MEWEDRGGLSVIKTMAVCAEKRKRGRKSFRAVEIKTLHQEEDQ